MYTSTLLFWYLSQLQPNTRLLGYRIETDHRSVFKEPSLFSFSCKMFNNPSTNSHYMLYYYKKHRGGGMRATVLSWAISMMVMGCIVVWLLPLRCFLILRSNYTCLYNYNEYFSNLDESEFKYSKPPILPSRHFWWVVNVFHVWFQVQTLAVHYLNVNTKVIGIRWLVILVFVLISTRDPHVLISHLLLVSISFSK